MQLMQFTTEELRIIAAALDMNANYIETGTVTHTAIDAANHNRGLRAKELPRRQPVPINALTSEQMQKVVAIRGLAALIVSGLNI